MTVDVISAKYLGNYRLRIRFSDGSEGVHDFARLVREDGPMITPLRNPSYFARTSIEFGAITWPNGFDLDPIKLHRDMALAGELEADDPEQVHDEQGASAEEAYTLAANR